MKKLLPLLVALVALVALFAPVAVFAANFEGKITMKMSGPKDAPPAMTFSLKEGFSRLDMIGGGQNAAVIYDVAKQQITILMLDQKMYMIQAMPKLETSPGGLATSATDGTLKVTTIREKILGYDCVKYVEKSPEGTSEIWATDQLGGFQGFGGPPAGSDQRGPGAPPPQGWETALAGKGVFPLRVITTAGGKETFRLEATAVEKVALPAQLFYAPADYQDLSAMLKSMGMSGGIPGLPGGK
jgi:hypothetical protein